MKRRLLFPVCCLAASCLLAPAQQAALDDAPPPRAEVVEEPSPEEVVPRAEPVMEEEPASDTDAAPPKAIPVEEDAEEVRPAKPADPAEPEPIPVKPVPREEEEPLTVKAVPDSAPLPLPPAAPADRKPEKARMPVSLNTDPNARPLSLRVPAPRGQIVDRNGVSLAQNRIAYYLGVQLPLQDGLTDAQVFDAARGPVAWVRRTMTSGWDITDEKILEHYHKRRWVPMLSASLIPDKTVEEVKDKLPAGVVLRPFYLRTYPKETMASHLLGYMGKSGSMSTGDILADELLWPPTVGKYGLEQRFDEELTGKPGIYNVLYNAAGEKLSEDWVERPTAGHTVVTSLDSRFQAIVETEMRQSNVRGAFVIMDVKTGDVVAMCSNPGYNPNDWAYGIDSEQYNKYLTDKQNPLLPRALQGVYPPASTFKVVTALAALNSGKVGPNTYFNCPKGMMFGRTWMWNHSHRDEGSMDVVRAIKRSCNPWFWQAAKVGGGADLSALGIAMGFGEKTGICLANMEAAGNMPSPEYYEKKKTSMSGGILANVSIGQGEVSATPLQVCQMMAAIGRGDAVPRPRLVRQIQGVDGRIVQNFPPTIRTTLSLDKDGLQAVRKGMRAVVADGDGTGTRASNNYVSIAGKTGTGEWHESPKDYVAWFAGFIPATNPEYAYAALYEGDPGDQISGGKIVAPIVGDVFNKIYKIKKTGKEMPEDEGEAAEEGEGDEERKTVANSRRRRSNANQPNAPAATTVRPAAPVATEAPKTGLRGWFNKLRNKGNKPATPPAGRP